MFTTLTINIDAFYVNNSSETGIKIIIIHEIPEISFKQWVIQIMEVLMQKCI